MTKIVFIMLYGISVFTYIYNLVLVWVYISINLYNLSLCFEFSLASSIYTHEKGRESGSFKKKGREYGEWGEKRG